MTSQVVVYRRDRSARPVRSREARKATGLLARYQGFCYHLLGQRLDRQKRRKLQDHLKQADYHVSPGLYLAMWIMTPLWSSLAGGVVVAPVMFWAGGNTGWIVAVGVALICGLATAIAFPFALGTRIQNRKADMDKELPFTLSELAVLASIGLSPIKLIQRMARRDHDPKMTGEFRKVQQKTRLQGKDIITALAETARESPSAMVRDTFWDLGNMIHQGGNVGLYLQNRSSEVLETKRSTQKEFVERLQTYADMYVTVALMGVIFLGIGAFLMDSFGSTAGGLDADGLLVVLAYGLIPLMVIMLSILLATAYTQVE